MRILHLKRRILRAFGNRPFAVCRGESLKLPKSPVSLCREICGRSDMGFAEKQGINREIFYFSGQNRREFIRM